MLDESCAIFYPVPRVGVRHAVDGTEFRNVDVPADYAVHLVTASPLHDGRFEVGDVLDGTLGRRLGSGGERPVRLVHPSPHAVDVTVEGEKAAVRPASNLREPAGVAHHAVELVAVQDKETPPVGGFVNGPLLDGDVSELKTGKLSGGLVVVAGDVGHLGLSGSLQQDLQQLVVGGGPIPGALQRPAVNDIADEVILVGLVMGEKVEKTFYLGGPSAKVDI